MTCDKRSVSCSSQNVQIMTSNVTLTNTDGAASFHLHAVENIKQDDTSVLLNGLNIRMVCSVLNTSKKNFEMTFYSEPEETKDSYLEIITCFNSRFQQNILLGKHSIQISVDY